MLSRYEINYSSIKRSSYLPYFEWAFFFVLADSEKHGKNDFSYPMWQIITLTAQRQEIDTLETGCRI